MKADNSNLMLKGNKTVAIHQPNYFPWLGYFSKIKKSDLFVFLDDSQFSKNSWQNRVCIKSPIGKQFLTQPINRPNGISTPTNKIIFSSKVWKSKHLKSIELNYKKAIFFNEFFPIVESILKNESEELVNFNIFAIKTICDYLNIKINYFISSKLKVNGTSSQRLINILKSLNSLHYIHGKGGNNYHDVDLFKANKIKLTPINYKSIQYKQLWNEFIPGLSILDACFNLNKEYINKIL